jgi:hypothetical protein
LQSAYRVLVATSEKQLQANVGNKWDSGKVNSDRSVNVEYRGEPLSSGEKCYWKARVWDKKGRPSTWSQPGSFEVGLMEQSDWKGQWIGLGVESNKTVRGVISSSWKRTNDSFVLEVEIPANSTARVSVPTFGLEKGVITEGGKTVWKDASYVSGVAGVTGAGRDGDWVTFDIGSGRYCFELRGAKSDRP